MLQDNSSEITDDKKDEGSQELEKLTSILFNTGLLKEEIALSILNGVLSRGASNYDQYTNKRDRENLMKFVFDLADNFIKERERRDD